MPLKSGPDVSWQGTGSQFVQLFMSFVAESEVIGGSSTFPPAGNADGSAA